MKKSSLNLALIALVSTGLYACSSSQQAPITSLWNNPNAVVFDSKANTHTVTTAVASELKEQAQLPADQYYTVQAGDTLYSISKRTGADLSALKSINQITDPSQLAIGQKLRLPAAAVTTAETVKETTSAKVAEVKEVVTETRQTAVVSNSNWVWPTSGKVVKSFSTATRGIDIEGKEGQPVYAATDGVVSYSGNGLRGFGNLILITHSNKYITAYAHNQKLLVNKGARVKKGQQIATLGKTDTDSPKLHFEIRQDGTPVNPLNYLPK